LKDNTADSDRLLNALKSRLKSKAISVDLELMHRLPQLLRESKYKVRCILFKDRSQWLLLDVTPANDSRLIAGLAIDLGTTRVVLRLIDLVDGRVMAESAFDNPQDSIGPDILARIHFADQAGGLEKLNTLILNGLNRAIGDLCAASALER